MDTAARFDGTCELIRAGDLKNTTECANSITKGIIEGPGAVQ